MSRPHLTSRRPVPVAVVVLACVLALIAGALVVVHVLRGHEIGTAGGLAASDDGAVVVRFGPGEVDAGTRVELRTGLGGPPPPADVASHRWADPSTSPRSTGRPAPARSPPASARCRRTSAPSW